MANSIRKHPIRQKEKKYFNMLISVVKLCFDQIWKKKEQRVCKIYVTTSHPFEGIFVFSPMTSGEEFSI